MNKVCDVYLATSDERSMELVFPVSQYELMDAFEQLGAQSPKNVYWQIDEFYRFNFSPLHLDEELSIFEFNALTEQLSKLAAWQETALGGLLQMQVEEFFDIHFAQAMKSKISALRMS